MAAWYQKIGEADIHLLAQINIDAALYLLIRRYHTINGIAYPSLRLLRDDLNRVVSVSTIRRALHRLRDKGLIEIEFRSGYRSIYTPKLPAATTPTPRRRQRQQQLLFSTAQADREYARLSELVGSLFFYEFFL